MTLTLIPPAETSPAPTPARLAPCAPRYSGVRGLLEAATGRGSSREARPLAVRAEAASRSEARYGATLARLLGGEALAVDRVRYRGRAGDEVLEGRGVRADLGAGRWAERLRFRSPGAARRFAVLHAGLGPWGLIEVRGCQVAWVAAPLHARDLPHARAALWSLLHAPSVAAPTLLLARSARGTWVALGSLDRRTRGLLRALLDRSEEAVALPGAEEARAPGGGMHQARGRVWAWLEPRPERRRATARLAARLEQRF